MKQTILGQDTPTVRSQLKKKIYILIAAAVTVLACNIVFVFISSEDNYRIYMLVNMATDIAAGILFVMYISAYVTYYAQNSLRTPSPRNLPAPEQ